MWTTVYEHHLTTVLKLSNFDHFQIKIIKSQWGFKFMIYRSKVLIVTKSEYFLILTIFLTNNNSSSLTKYFVKIIANYFNSNINRYIEANFMVLFFS